MARMAQYTVHATVVTLSLSSRAVAVWLWRMGAEGRPASVPDTVMVGGGNHGPATILHAMALGSRAHATDRLVGIHVFHAKQSALAPSDPAITIVTNSRSLFYYVIILYGWHHTIARLPKRETRPFSFPSCKLQAR